MYVIENIIANEVSLTGDPINDGSVLLMEEEDMSKKEITKGEQMKVDEIELKKSEDFEREELLKSFKALKAENEALLAKVQKSECTALAEENFDNVIRISKSEGDLTDVLLFLKSNHSSHYQTTFKSLAAIEKVLKSRLETLEVPTAPIEKSNDINDDIQAGLAAAMLS